MDWKDIMSNKNKIRKKETWDEYKSNPSNDYDRKQEENASMMEHLEKQDIIARQEKRKQEEEEMYLEKDLLFHDIKKENSKEKTIKSQKDNREISNEFIEKIKNEYDIKYIDKIKKLVNKKSHQLRSIIKKIDEIKYKNSDETLSKEDKNFISNNYVFSPIGAHYYMSLYNKNKYNSLLISASSAWREFYKTFLNQSFDKKNFHSSFQHESSIINNYKDKFSLKAYNLIKNLSKNSFSKEEHIFKYFINKSAVLLDLSKENIDESYNLLNKAKKINVKNKNYYIYIIKARISKLQNNPKMAKKYYNLSQDYYF